MGVFSMRTKNSSLNPCKKCGYDRVHRTDRIYLGMDEGYLIQCPRCRSKAPAGYLIQDAVEAWNLENPLEEAS